MDPSIHQMLVPRRWQRLSSLSSSLNPRLVIDLMVEQGGVGDNYVIGCVGVLGFVRIEAIRNVFVCYDIEVGVYGVRMYVPECDAWTYVIVDDFVPTAIENPIYGWSNNRSELAPAIIEKAFAKRSGSYGSLDGGSAAEALVRMTGASAHRFDFSSTKVLLERRSGALWDRVANAVRSNRVLIAMRLDERISDDAPPSKRGLLANRVYGVVGTFEFGGYRLLAVFDSHRRSKWTGPWSNGSAEWEIYGDVTAHVQRARGIHRNSNVFFMSFNDFAVEFNTLDIFKLPRPSNFHTDEPKAAIETTRIGRRIARLRRPPLFSEPSPVSPELYEKISSISLNLQEQPIVLVEPHDRPTHVVVELKQSTAVEDVVLLVVRWRRNHDFVPSVFVDNQWEAPVLLSDLRMADVVERVRGSESVLSVDILVDVDSDVATFIVPSASLPGRRVQADVVLYADGPLSLSLVDRAPRVSLFGEESGGGGNQHPVELAMTVDRLMERISELQINSTSTEQRGMERV